MRVAALQLDIAWEDPSANYARVEPWAAAASAAGARLFVLPEMFACGFSMNTASIREAPGGPSTRFLQDLARRHGMWTCGSIAIEQTSHEKPYNTLVLADPGGKLEFYRKIHPFTFAREHEHYAAGSSPLTVDIEGFRTTFFVCYDLRFADEFWVTATDTHGYVVVANWPQKRRRHWSTLLQARAIENQAYVIGVNRVGLGNGIEYVGDSCIVDPWGECLATAAQGETMLVADVDPTRVSQARAKFPVLPDRRKLLRD